MFDLFEKTGNRPIPLEASGPGDIVKRKYDAALGRGLDLSRDSVLRFFASGAGKGILAVAAITVGIMVVASVAAAATGALPVAGAIGVGNATLFQGLMIGLSDGLGVLFSGAGLLAMAGGALVGAAVEGRRHPEYLSVEQAQALSEQYAHERQNALEQKIHQSIQEALEPEKAATAPAPTTANNSLAQAGTPNTEASFAAREMQRRAQNADMQPQIG